MKLLVGKVTKEFPWEEEPGTSSRGHACKASISLVTAWVLLFVY
jgi:hypothetical protein